VSLRERDVSRELRLMPRLPVNSGTILTSPIQIGFSLPRAWAGAMSSSRNITFAQPAALPCESIRPATSASRTWPRSKMSPIASSTERGMAYGLSQGGGNRLSVRILSTLDLDRQVGSDRATWLDRELASRNRTPLVAAGFGREVTDALERRRQSLVNMGYATRLPDERIQGPKDLVAPLERAEIARVGPEMAAARKLTFRPPLAGKHVSGRLLGSAHLASGRFAMIETLIGDGGPRLQPRTLATRSRSAYRSAHHWRNAG